ncbi:hypothetical protein SAMN05892883_3479 [Jatrophihabitans sp. GAS493]|uniref:hypothetical protein n=1 Tax=Jatrophihabitans sp. GAS493 TaxID=1907575 RepID=UPI000BB8EAF1|nr:hypothetical protein [Jatrophihabitans sp. GAS493]SOD74296.1 hypothetical protein SAMN05892883_3479 [Jatrophihabitans sp. GAS493]
MFSEDDLKDTPPVVIGAIACGVAPIPFLLTYSAIFLMHGTVFPVDPPDITNSRLGEAFAGVVALVYLVAIIVSIGWFLSQRRRWFFLLGQLLSLVVAVDFLLDTSSGDPEVPLMLVITTFGAIVMGLLPASYHWVHDWRFEQQEANDKVTSRRKSRRAAAEPAAEEPLADLSLLESVGGSPIDPNPNA